MRESRPPLSGQSDGSTAKWSQRARVSAWRPGVGGGRERRLRARPPPRATPVASTRPARGVAAGSRTGGRRPDLGERRSIAERIAHCDRSRPRRPSRSSSGESEAAGQRVDSRGEVDVAAVLDPVQRCQPVDGRVEVAGVGRRARARMAPRRAAICQSRRRRPARGHHPAVRLAGRCLLLRSRIWIEPAPLHGSRQPVQLRGHAQNSAPIEAPEGAADDGRSRRHLGVSHVTRTSATRLARGDADRQPPRFALLVALFGDRRAEVGAAVDPAQEADRAGAVEVRGAVAARCAAAPPARRGGPAGRDPDGERARLPRSTRRRCACDPDEGGVGAVSSASRAAAATAGRGGDPSRRPARPARRRRAARSRLRRRRPGCRLAGAASSHRWRGRDVPAGAAAHAGPEQWSV